MYHKMVRIFKKILFFKKLNLLKIRNFIKILLLKFHNLMNV